MIAQYTETYETYKENGGEEYSSLWSNFPSFTLNNLNLNMYDMFYDKYRLREIGAETEEMFEVFYKNKLNELIVKYVPKLNAYISNWNKLFERKISLSNSGSNSYFLNPMTPNGNLKLDDKDTYENTQERPLSMFGKTNAELMEQVMNLKDIFNDCLNEFNSIFMMLY